MLMRTHNRTVDKHFFKIGITGQLREESMPDALPRPTGKTLIGAIPETELRMKVAPRTACGSDPEYRLDKQTIVCRVRPGTLCLPGSNASIRSN